MLKLMERFSISWKGIWCIIIWFLALNSTLSRWSIALWLLDWLLNRHGRYLFIIIIQASFIESNALLALTRLQTFTPGSCPVGSVSHSAALGLAQRHTCGGNGVGAALARKFILQLWGSLMPHKAESSASVLSDQINACHYDTLHWLCID